MRNLYFITGANKLSAIPETATGFRSKNIHSTGNHADDPSADIVHPPCPPEEGVSIGNTAFLYGVQIIHRKLF